MDKPKLTQKDEAFIRSQRLDDPKDFQRWFPIVAERLYKGRDRHPMSKKELNRLRLPSLRSGRGDLVPPPPSLKAILAFDRDFVAWGHEPLCAPLLSLVDQDNRVRGVTMEQILREAFPGMFETFPRHLPLWGAHPKMPALAEIHPCPKGHRQFLYVGEPDAQGEYPVVSFNTDPSLEIVRASLVHHVVEAMVRGGVPVEGTINFRALTAEASNRNHRFEPKEWWDTNPQLTALMSRLGLQHLLWGQQPGDGKQAPRG